VKCRGVLRKVMAPTRTSTASSAALLRAHIVVEALFGVGTMFGLQKNLSLLEPHTSSVGAKRGCHRNQTGDVNVGMSKNIAAVNKATATRRPHYSTMEPGLQASRKRAGPLT
jgi:hypothetical protein